MTPEVEDLFLQLADLPPGERARRLEASDISPDVRREVALLLAQDLSGQTSEALLSVVQQQAQRALSGGRGHAGEMAGAYRLTNEIGRGGMGVVYLAEREDGQVQQRAAVKLLSPHLAEIPGMTGRFLNERRIQASLSHPAIARLFDAGVTSGGALYLTMEYCEGEPIDVYCRRAALDTRAVVRLFLQVCDAVAHAHALMVVHRDLKPSNILVTAQGGVKLLDFGIAKVLQPPGATAEPTLTLAPMLTLAYASPEQVRGEPASAACDVYSLGAVLYRLLTGHCPHESDNAADLPGAITGQDPRRPCHWKPQLPADIENILLTALRREPARRYATVEALADDLRRWLDLHPVRATPPSLAYRVRRFVQRNPAAAAASALAVLSLVGGAAFSAYQARQAQQRLNDIRQLANVFLFDFENSIRNVPGTLRARERVIETARVYLEKMQAHAVGDVALQREVADSYRALADVQWAADFSRRGAQATVVSLEQSRTIRRRLADERATDPRRLLPYIETTALVCYRSTLVGNLQRAKEACAEALGLAAAWSQREAASVDALRARQTSALAETALREAEGQPEAARAAAQRSYEAAADLLRREPRSRAELTRVLIGGRIYADMLIKIKRPQEALAPAAAAVGAGEALLALPLFDSESRRNTSAALMTLGSGHRLLAEQASAARPRGEHLEQSMRYLRQALSHTEAAMRRDPEDRNSKDAFVVASHRLGQLYVMRSEPAAGLAVAEPAREVARQILAAEPTSRRYQYVLANMQLQAGQFLAGLGRLPESDAALAESAAQLQKVFAVEANDATARETMISVDVRRAENAVRAGRQAQARERWQAAKSAADAMIARDPAARQYISDYALLESLGRRWGPSAGGARIAARMEITELLRRVHGGDREALNAVVPFVYEELRRLADSQLRRQGGEKQDLNATALVHEAFIRLAGGRHPLYENRSHFYGIAARLMRQILVDAARARSAQKRTPPAGGADRSAAAGLPPDDGTLLAMDEALDRLASHDARKSQLIEMRFFGGMSAEESAQALGLDVTTARRELRLAQAWLLKEMTARPAGEL